MIAKLLFLISTLFIQELVLLNALLLMVHHGLYSPILIFILFIVATVIDIVIGFYVGRYLRRKTSQSVFGRYIEKKSKRFSFSKESPKRWFTLLILGNVSFCYINAAVAGYLELPFWESQAYNFFGNVLFCVALWYIGGSVSSLFKNIYTAYAVVLIFIIIFSLRKIQINKV
jgi:membrane protein DedA with SNARE-associated domain